MYEQSEFYCINCGQRGLPLLRPRSHRREKFHRKKLYCPHCRLTINHVECKNEAEVYEFKQMFENDEFQQEAIHSIMECGGNE